MDERKQVVATNADDLWNELLPDFSDTALLHNYHVNATYGSNIIEIDITSSPGGGFEGGYGSTNIKTSLPRNNTFQFVLFPEDFLNRIGKLFGAEDVILGYPDLDDNVIIKTNNVGKLSTVLADAATRSVLATLSGYSLKLETSDDDDTAASIFELNIQRAVMDATEFHSILTAYLQVLSSL